MKSSFTRLPSGLLITGALAGLALLGAHLPVIEHIGPLATALLLGLGWRAVGPVPAGGQPGIAFAAKKLLRLGIILLGVRLNLSLLRDAGPGILILDASVIVVGLVGINWLGRRLGLDPVLACLIAVNGSICGGSAVAAAAPTLRARDADVALVIPLGSLIGTTAMLIFTFVQHHWGFTAVQYGLMAGATLQEVAHVIAAITPFPEAAELGTVTKLTRVVLLVPTVVVLGWIFERRRRRTGAGEAAAAEEAKVVVPKPWFVLGFLLVGVATTLVLHAWPAQRREIDQVIGQVLAGANFLMAMAMAGMGLQVDFARLRANGSRAFATALLGWLMLAGLAAGEIAVLGL